jgi:hypothetical protein
MAESPSLCEMLGKFVTGVTVVTAFGPEGLTIIRRTFRLFVASNSCWPTVEDHVRFPRNETSKINERVKGRMSDGPIQRSGAA